MKHYIYLLLIMVAECTTISSCIIKAEHEEVVKQVFVSVRTANLRTGPGTKYSVAPAPDGSSRKWQVSRGTLLNVVAAEKGWYRVFVNDSNHTAYIKQSLCSDNEPKAITGNAVTGKKKKNRQSDAAKSSETDNAVTANPTVASGKSSSAATDEDFEEEVEEAKFIPYTR